MGVEFLFCFPEPETEPTEPGPLGKKHKERERGREGPCVKWLMNNWLCVEVLLRYL